MKTLPIDSGKISQYLEYDPNTGLFRRKGKTSNRCVKGWFPGSLMSNGYRSLHIRFRTYYAHRLALALSGFDVNNKIVDHINGNPEDNRLCNLRLANKSENGLNRYYRKSLGTSRCRNRYRASICVDGKRLHLGYFDSQEEAHQAYLTYRNDRLGDFSSLQNSPHKET